MYPSNTWDLFDTRPFRNDTKTEDVGELFGVVGGDERFLVRPLRRTDYEQGYLELLSQLTTTGDISESLFHNTFDTMKTVYDTYYIVVIEDTLTKQIVASGSLILELKFIHKCGQRGRIEDIVVDSTYRGKQFGKTVVKCLISMSRHLQLYKISLECKDSNVNWYSSMGFVKEQGNSNYMQMRFEKS